MNTKVRVRFAPSPTGPLHIGGVRTALFNYLFAKKHKGSFILRIEDTDQSRFVPGAEEYIAESLDWLGIPFDEGPGKDGGLGPYRQSDRAHLYRDYANQLVSAGCAYYAFDTQKALETCRKDCEREGKAFIYNWATRDRMINSLTLGEKEVAEHLEKGRPFVIRFRWPIDIEIVLKDLIRGDIRIDGNTLDDKVLFKSDGMPTYHLANIVDDHLMKISHVIRGEEWLPSLALHVQLYKSFGWEPPQFAHLPLIMKPHGKGKLSKRDGEKLGFPVFPLQWKESSGYRESGYFPETVLNFLALLGWNPGTEQELFTKEELIEAFDLGRVQKSGARFDPEKNKWYNHQYLQKKTVSELALSFRGILTVKGIDEDSISDVFLEKVVSLIKERASFVSEFWDLASYFFLAPREFDEKAVRKQWKEETPGRMKALSEVLAGIVDFSAPNIEKVVAGWIGEAGFSFGQIMPPLRLILVGAMQGPHLYDVMELLGRAEAISRIKFAVETL